MAVRDYFFEELVSGTTGNRRCRVIFRVVVEIVNLLECLKRHNLARGTRILSSVSQRAQQRARAVEQQEAHHIALIRLLVFLVEGLFGASNLYQRPPTQLL